MLGSEASEEKQGIKSSANLIGENRFAGHLSFVEKEKVES